MYIWILLASIMVALSFFNLSPRMDKDNVLNEIRAASVTNRFQIEHEAMLKTMECEIIKRKNNGWDDYVATEDEDDEEIEGFEVVKSDKRASAYGPVDVSCFNPEFFKRDSNKTSPQCSSSNVYTAESDGSQMQQFVIAEVDEGKTPANYNHFDMHVPLGYDTTPYNVFPKGIHHFIYCLDVPAEEATRSENFVRCDLRKNCETIHHDDVTDEFGVVTTEAYDEEVCEDDGNSENNANAYKRYLVTFAQIPDKWLSKGHTKTPLAVFTNMLSKDTGSATVYGWTDCTGAVTEEGGIEQISGSCRLLGLNSRSGSIKRAGESRRYHSNDQKGVSLDIVRHDNVPVQDEETGELSTTPQKAVHQVFEYQVLKEDSVFWQNEVFKEICIKDEIPCLFAYEQFPGADTAYHCHNLMYPDDKKTNCPTGKEGRWCRYKQQKAEQEENDENGNATGGDEGNNSGE